MKDFYGMVSFTGRIAFSIKAETEKEAKDMVFEDLEGMTIDVKEGSPVGIDYIEWETIDQEARGNVNEDYIADFEIYEEK